MSLNITNLQGSNLVQTNTQQTPKHSSFCSRKATVLAGLGLLLASSIPFIQSRIADREKLGGDRFNAIKNSLGFPREDFTGCKFESTLSKIDISCLKAHYTSEWSPLFLIRETVQFTPTEANTEASMKMASIVSYEGALTSDTSGEGTYFYEDGSKGSVQWQKKIVQIVNSQQKGIHFYYKEGTWPVLRKYEGELENGLMHGEGTLFEVETNSELYTGQWKEGKKEGLGKGEYNGQLFEGEWKNDKPHGICSIFDKSGILIYKGEVRDGLREGMGTEFHANGKGKYVGQWQDDLRHGIDGKEIDDNGMCTFIGSWHRGKKRDTGSQIPLVV